MLLAASNRQWLDAGTVFRIKEQRYYSRKGGE